MADDGDDGDEFWFCMKHRAVEGHDGCPGKDRIGPFPTYGAAAHALQTIAEREASYDAEDAAERGDEADSR